MKRINLTNLDWERLRELRHRFLENASENYWKDPHDLELYDLIYAQRIGWKWEAVLQQLSNVGWKPCAEQLLDWGCGTGIASRRVAAWSGIQRIGLFDQSPLATAFAREKHLEEKREMFFWNEKNVFETPTLFLISHVLSELSDTELHELATLAARASEVIWVEPGSHELSRKLGSVRNIFINAGHHLIAPCVHNQPCPMFEQKNSHDWCHFFAPPPTEIFQSSLWHEASRELGIDLRSLPYSYLAFSRHHHPSAIGSKERLIGYPRALKAHGKILCCGTSGLCERTLQKRDNPALFKRLIKNQEEGIFDWQLDPVGRIVSGEKMHDNQPYCG
jgi:hypothetical protein